MRRFDNDNINNHYNDRPDNHHDHDNPAQLLLFKLQPVHRRRMQVVVVHVRTC